LKDLPEEADLELFGWSDNHCVHCRHHPELQTTFVSNSLGGPITIVLTPWSATGPENAKLELFGWSDNHCVSPAGQRVWKGLCARTLWVVR
jgi:hypothetical protein